MKFFKKISSRTSVLAELFSFLWQNRLWWMIPLATLFILLGLLIFLTQSAAVTPFIYTLF